MDVAPVSKFKKFARHQLFKSVKWRGRKKPVRIVHDDIIYDEDNREEEVDSDANLLLIKDEV